MLFLNYLNKATNSEEFADDACFESREIWNFINPADCVAVAMNLAFEHVSSGSRLARNEVALGNV